MISTFKNKIPGGFLISAYYRQADKPKFYTRITADETRAENLIKQIKKEVLREKVTKFLNHRQNIMDNHGGLRTMDKYNAIETLKKNFAFLEKHSLESNCKLILDYEELFKSILPGQQSIFYQSQKDVLFELLDFCQLEIKIKI